MLNMLKWLTIIISKMCIEIGLIALYVIAEFQINLIYIGAVYIQKNKEIKGCFCILSWFNRVCLNVQVDLVCHGKTEVLPDKDGVDPYAVSTLLINTVKILCHRCTRIH